MGKTMCKIPHNLSTIQKIIRPTSCLNIVNTNLNLPSPLPVGPPTTPLEMHTPSPVSYSSHSAEPKPIRIRQHTHNEIDRINHCQEFLAQNFPEDQPEGTFANPILVKDDDDEDIVFPSEK
jgi:hypothetical protein